MLKWLVAVHPVEELIQLLVVVAEDPVLTVQNISQLQEALHTHTL
jgi:hypothetical protein